MATKKVKTVKRKRTAPLSPKQKAALAKGRKIFDKALEIMKASGTHTIPAKTVYNMKLTDAMKKAKTSGVVRIINPK